MIRRIAEAFLLVLFLSSTIWAQGPGGPNANHPGGTHAGAGPGSLPGWSGHELEHNLVLAQMAAGRDITTTLIVSSQANRQMMTWAEAEDLEVTGTIHFFHQDGSPFQVRVNGTLVPGVFEFRLAASETAFLEVASEGPNQAGWALISVADNSQGPGWGQRDGHSLSRGERLSATAFYTVFGPNGRLATRVAVIPAMYQREHFWNASLPAFLGPAVNTGVALVNTGSDPLAATLRLRDAQGQILVETELSLAAGQQISRFLDELFDQGLPATLQGRLEVAGDGEGLVVLGLLSTQGILTTIPTHHFGSWASSPPHMP